MDITVVTLVEEQMSPWKGNLPKLPIESNIVCLATTSIVALEVILASYGAWWKGVAWFRLSREGDEDGRALENKIYDVMMIRSLQCGDGAACNMWCELKIMVMKSAFLYGTIEEEVYVCQPPGFEDPEFPNKVYKVYVDDIIFGSTKNSLCTEFEQMMHKRFQMSSMGELTFFLGLQVKQKDNGIFISQDKYVADILKKFDFATVKTDSTPMETNKALLKDEEAADVDVHLYRSMIGSFMYLTAFRLDIMFVVCTCARFQVTPKTSHLHAVKRIFRYLKGHPKLGLWYPRDSPFDLEDFSDNDYAGTSLDRKSTTGGCQFLRRRLISWQCKKQTIVANSTTEAENRSRIGINSIAEPVTTAREVVTTANVVVSIADVTTASATTIIVDELNLA
ncbi:putative ribonuclease H-like domain-containing protein [Tanacetum coccineum]